MKNIIITTLLFSFVSVFAKKEDVPVPMWMTLEGREIVAPTHECYSAFSQVRCSDKKNLSKDIQEAKSFAKKYLVETIESNVKSTTESRFVESGVGKKSVVSSSYKSNVFTSADIDIVGLKIDYFVSSREKMVYAFAFLKKDDLFSYYKARVEQRLSALENDVSVANQAQEYGDIPSARRSCANAQKRIPSIQNDESVLNAVSSFKAASISARIELAFSALRNIEQELSKCLHIYVRSEENVFGKNTSVLSNKLSKELSAENCCIVKTENDADYILYIKAKTRKADYQSEFKYSYADIVFELKNTKTGLVVLKEGFAYKGGSTNYEKAGYDALSRSSSKIFQSIKEKLFDY